MFTPNGGASTVDYCLSYEIVFEKNQNFCRQKANNIQRSLSNNSFTGNEV